MVVPHSIFPVYIWAYLPIDRPKMLRKAAQTLAKKVRLFVCSSYSLDPPMK
jgi:hypothetical protein